MLTLALAAVVTALLIVIGIWVGYRPSAPIVEPPVVEPELESLEPAAEEAEPAEFVEPVAPQPEPLLIRSDPAGATVKVDGQPLEEPTPTSVELEPGEEIELVIELDGYETARRSVSLAELGAKEREAAAIVVSLEKTIPPGRLRIQARYPVEVRAAGRRYSVSRGVAELPPGRHRITISAPSVFYSTTRELQIRSGATTEVSMPATAPLKVAANPSRCRLRIDGRDAGDLPADLQVTLGTHEFEFVWDGLGQSTTITREITPDTGRLFAAAER